MNGGKGHSRGGWASKDDYTLLSLGVIMVGLGLGGWWLWKTHHAVLVEAVSTLQLWKMAVISRFTHDYDALAKSVATADYANIRFGRLVAMCSHVSTFFRVPAMGLIGALAVVCFVWAPSRRYRRNLDLDGLAREQSRFFRAASAALGRGLRLVPIRDGVPRPADPSLHAHEWVERFGSKNGGYHAATAEAALVRQLGPVWRGVEAASAPARVMFAAFALHLAGRREEALGLLGDLAQALAADCGHGPAGPDAPLAVPAAVLAAADGFLAQPQLRRPAEAVAHRHAFETTALMGLLNTARLDSGVLAPAQFNSLKLLDRNLWYALHSLGFPGHGPGQNAHLNPRVEAIGARAHWDAERLARCALFRPEVAPALRAVRAAVEQHRDEQKEQA